jgi:hypothetical protein
MASATAASAFTIGGADDRRQSQPNGPAAAERGNAIEHQPGRRHVAFLGGGNHRLDYILGITGHHPLDKAGGAVPGAELHAGRIAATAWGELSALHSTCVIRTGGHIRILADRAMTSTATWPRLIRIKSGYLR